MKLKELYDAAKAADEKVQEVMQEMITAFEDGTEEGKLKALDLRPALDEAKAKAEEANRLYISARDADFTDPDNAARMFVPLSDDGQPKKQMSRTDYDRLSLIEQAQFIRSGGSVED